jgi:hypothetical protein
MVTTTLRGVRDRLLELHKVLLDYQKGLYEADHGKIENPNVYYNLVVNDAAFAWLRTLSALVVSVDELLESKEGVGEEKAKQIADYVKKLLSGQGTDSAFTQNYTLAVHANPTIAGHHADVMAQL